MRLGNWAAYAAGVTVVVLSAVSTAQAQVVTFSEIKDAVPARFFDAATTVPGQDDANTLVIGFHTGIDWSTWKYSDFRASTSSYSYTTAMDTISFVVEAPEGFYISKITYSQRGIGSVIRTGSASGGGNWIVGDTTANLGTHGTNPTWTRSMNLEGKKLTRVPVSITSSLFAFSTPTLGAANVSILGAEVSVELAPLEATAAPVPQDTVPQ